MHTILWKKHNITLFWNDIIFKKIIQKLPSKIKIILLILQKCIVSFIFYVNCSSTCLNRFKLVLLFFYLLLFITNISSRILITSKLMIQYVYRNIKFLYLTLDTDNFITDNFTVPFFDVNFWYSFLLPLRHPIK